MADPSILRAEVTRLRTNAKTMRQQASALISTVDEIAQHYPAGDKGVWGGKAADSFYGELGTARRQLSSVESDVDAYASDCERKATQLDQQAEDEASKQPGKH